MTDRCICGHKRTAKNVGVIRGRAGELLTFCKACQETRIGFYIKQRRLARQRGSISPSRPARGIHDYCARCFNVLPPHWGHDRCERCVINSEFATPLVHPQHVVDAQVTGYVLVFGVLLALFIFALALFGGR